MKHALAHTPLPRLVTTLVLLAAGYATVVTSPAAGQVERADVRGFQLQGGGRLAERDLRLTLLQHDAYELGGGARREQGRVSWTRRACGSGCYAGEGAELPVSFAAYDSAAARLVVVRTVWTTPEGRFDVTLPDPAKLRRRDGSPASALGEYVVIVETERARDLPPEARRLLKRARSTAPAR